MFPWHVQHLLFPFPDSGQNCSAGGKGERLSAQLRALPGTDEPYESSSNKEPGECPWPMGLPGWWRDRLVPLGAGRSFCNTDKASPDLEGIPVHFGLLTVDDKSNWFYICCFSYSSNVTICSETQTPPMWIRLALK